MGQGSRRGPSLWCPPMYGLPLEIMEPMAMSTKIPKIESVQQHTAPVREWNGRVSAMQNTKSHALKHMKKMRLACTCQDVKILDDYPPTTLRKSESPTSITAAKVAHTMTLHIQQTIQVDTALLKPPSQQIKGPHALRLGAARDAPSPHQRCSSNQSSRATRGMWQVE
jgi:hypothetical protein